MVQCLPSKFKSLNSIPITEKKKGGGQERIKEKGRK
jgi:hypothetical protein